MADAEQRRCDRRMDSSGNADIATEKQAQNTGHAGQNRVCINEPPDTAIAIIAAAGVKNMHCQTFVRWRCSAAVVLICAFVSLSNIYCGDSSTDQKPDVAVGPRLSIEPAMLNLGLARQGAVVTGKFTIANIGNEPLEIDKLSVSCTCLTVESDRRSLAPGEQVEIVVTMEANAHEKQIVQSVLLRTNDPAQPNIRYKVVLDVAQQWSLDEEQIDFGSLQWNQARPSRSLMLRYVPFGDDPARLQTRVLRFDRRLLDVQVDQETSGGPVGDGESSTAVITVSLRQDIPLGRFNDTIVIEAEIGETVQQWAVPVKGEVTGPISAQPASLMVYRDQIKAGDLLGTIRIKGDRIYAERFETPQVVGDDDLLAVSLVESSDTTADGNIVATVNVLAKRAFTRAGGRVTLRCSPGILLEVPVIIITGGG